MSDRSGRPAAVATSAGSSVTYGPKSSAVVLPEKLIRCGPLMFRLMVFPVLRFVIVTKSGPAIIAVLANWISLSLFGLPAWGVKSTSNPHAAAAGTKKEVNGMSWIVGFCATAGSANTSSNSVSVLFNDGSGGRGAAAAYAVGSGPQAVAVADFDGDGRPDFAVANIDVFAVSVLLARCP